MIAREVDFSSMSDEERIRLSERIFIKYPQLKEILKKVDDCHQLAKLSSEPPCLIITGPSGAGKTTISRYFRELQPRRNTEEGTVVPVLTATIPCPASVKSLATSLLDSLGDPIPDKGSTVSQTIRLYKLIGTCGVELIILDEFQHIIDRDRLKVLSTAAGWLKNLVNHTGKPVVLMGMPGSDRILDADDQNQLERRFSSRLTLDPFGWGEKKLEDDFRKFLQLVDEKLPFNERSRLSSWETALRIHYATGGVVGKVMALIRAATVKVIKNGQTQITLNHLAEVYEEKWGIAERMRRGSKYLNPFEAPKEQVAEGPPQPEPIDESQPAARKGGSKKGKLGVFASPSPKSSGNLIISQAS